jgi:GNAT superfamily N-acetyltransferase
VSDETRGTGAGAMLLEAAMAFCRAQAYRRVQLWTFDELHAARHLYEKHGFTMNHSQRGSQWGKEVNEQLFVRET